MSAVDTVTRLVPGAAVREGGVPVGGAAPAATVTPTSVDEVGAVLAAAAAEGFGVVPMGGGTDLGVISAREPFVVLSTRGLTGVDVYEPADLTMSVGAGTTLEELDGVTSPHRQWLPFDPPMAPRRTLGGLAATGTRGPMGASYGAPRDHILGLTLVTGDGRILRLGGRVMKNVAGFDLVKLAVGSRGTLGVITSVSVRLFPRPERELALVLQADAVADLVPAARAVATAPVVPASAVIAAGGGSTADVTLPALVVRLHGASETVAADAARIQAHVGRSFDAVEGEKASALFDALRDHASEQPVAARLTALPASLGDVLGAATVLGDGTRIVADVMSCRARVSAAQASPESLTELRDALDSMDGRCTVERAPAEVVAGLVPRGPDPASAALSRALKERFDPRHVLWPSGGVS